MGLTFKNADEARAWDMYVAGSMPCTSPADIADSLIIERRKRMPEQDQALYNLGKWRPAQ